MSHYVLTWLLPERDPEPLIGFPFWVPGRKDENMVEETISQIEARIIKAKSLNDERKKELLDLLSNLKTEVSQLSKTDAEDAQSIIGFTEVSIHEAIREEKQPQLLNLSLKGLSTSVKRFENSHPKLVGIVNSICNTLSNIGI
jgi:hypothetical protein